MTRLLLATLVLAAASPAPAGETYPGWKLLAQERDVEAVEIFREDVLARPDAARSAAGWALVEASEDKWRIAARLLRAAFMAPDAKTLRGHARTGAARERVAKLILRNQERLVIDPIDRDTVFVHAALYTLIDDRPAARYASLLLADIGDASEAAARLRTIAQAPDPDPDPDPAPEPTDPIDYNALRTRIGHMSDLLDRFSRKLTGRLSDSAP